MPDAVDTLKTKRTLEHDGALYEYFSLPEAARHIGDVSHLPFSLKVMLENLLRHEDGGQTVAVRDIEALSAWLERCCSSHEIAFRPARVLMQDFTGVPAVADLAAMRDAVKAMGGEPDRINPLSPVDLVIDHSVTVDVYGTKDASERNMALEFQRNRERYEFLRWGQQAFDNFRVVPPGTGICHQVNLEHLAQVVFCQTVEQAPDLLYPDTCVGTDSHTTMVNGLGVLGWGVGGIEAEAVMLGQPVSMRIPEVVGYRLTGRLREGVSATDLVLTITENLRELGVVGKFVEFHGAGLSQLSLPDRATIANMAPEYGATCGIFPIDAETVRYLSFTNRNGALVESYARANGLWHGDDSPTPIFSAEIELDLSTVEPSLAGPKRPQDRVSFSQAEESMEWLLAENPSRKDRSVPIAAQDYSLHDGDLVIAAITSCTNTSNPNALVAAGLLAQNARRKGLQTRPWVKTSLAPGSQVVADYLEAAGLQTHLDALGFTIAGFGCTTCIGNSGPLKPEIAAAVDDNEMTVVAVLSGNRNFEGRISPHVNASYLASPALVVVYALAGTMRIDLTTDPIGVDRDGTPVYLKDIWPSNDEISDLVRKTLKSEMFARRYLDVFKGPPAWRNIEIAAGKTYRWEEDSTYVRRPPFFADLSSNVPILDDIRNARVLGIFGDSLTTDHISPAGSIKEDSPAGVYLKSKGVNVADFNSYGARRGNHEVMMRGTFANIRIKNLMLRDKQGGFTRHYPSGSVLSIYDAAMRYQADGIPLVVIGGTEYGTGSSRDWAAKGPLLLGVRAVIAESFERIHRTNLVCMGVLPLQFEDDVSAQSLQLTGEETITITGVASLDKPGQRCELEIVRPDGSMQTAAAISRIDTDNELAYFKNGGILNYVLRGMTA